MSVTVVSNTVVAEQDIHPEMVLHVAENTRAVIAQVDIHGMEAVVYVVVNLNTVVAEPDIPVVLEQLAEANIKAVLVQVGILGMEAVAC